MLLQSFSEPSGPALGLSLVCAAEAGAALTSRLRGSDPASGWLALLDVATGLVSVVIGSALILGWVGYLSAPGFLTLHMAMATVACAADLKRPTRVPTPPLARLSLVRAADGVRRGVCRVLRGEPVLVATLAILLTAFGVAAAWTPALNPDSQAYRLPRIALWLEQGHLGSVAGPDPRLDYIGWNPDLVMLWIVCFFRVGYPLVQLVSWAGAVIASVATFGLAKLTGLSDRLSLTAALALLAMPNVATQAFTSQTDLFTAGFFWTAVACGLSALREPAWRGARVAGLALGVAIGAKGTVFYALPGLAILAVVAASGLGASRRTLLRCSIPVLLLALPLGLPPWARNVAVFGNPLGPSAERARVHVAPSGPRLRFAAVNAGALAWQFLDPTSNLPLLREFLRPAFRAGEEALEEMAARRPPFPGFLDQLEVHGRALAVEGRLHEDFASPGLLVPLLAVAGLLASGLRRSREDPRTSRLVWALALQALGFSLVFVALQAWTPHKLRYFVLIGPPLAIAATLALRCARRAGGLASWAAVVALASMAVTAFMTSRSHGLPALIDARTVPGFLETRMREDAVDALGVTPIRLGLALPSNSRLAPLLRRPVRHSTIRIDPSTVPRSGNFGDLLRARGLDALIVDLDALSLPAGDVRASWAAPDAAWAVLRAAEPERRTRGLCADVVGVRPDGSLRQDASFRAYLVPDGVLRLGFYNGAATERSVEVTMRHDEWRLDLAPGEFAGLELPAASPETVQLHLWPFAPEGRGVRLLLPEGLSCTGGPSTTFSRIARERSV